MRELPTLRWYRRILIVLMAFGVIAGLPDLWARVHAEQGDRRVELVADQQTFVQLADEAGVSPADFMRQLQAVGVQGLGVSEDTLGSLDQQGRVTVVSGADWLGARRAAGLPTPGGPPVDPSGTYALVPAADGALQSFIASGLQRALGPGQAVSQQSVGDVVAIGTDLSPDVAADLPLGFGPDAFALAQATGMDVVPRAEVAASAPGGGTTVQVLLGQITASGVPVHTLLFAGAATVPVPGYPGGLGLLAREMQANGWHLGVAESAEQLDNVVQPGTVELYDAIGQQAVRIYSVPPWLLQRYSPSQAVTSLVGGVEERNLRMLYLHPLQDGTNLIPRTVALYGDVARDLRAQGYALAPPLPIPLLRVTTPQRILQALGAAAAGLLLLDLFVPGVRRYGFAPLVAVEAAACLVALATHGVSVDLAGGAAAASFGGLAMFTAAGLWNRWRDADPRGFVHVWGRATAAAVVMAAVTFAGALIVAALMGDSAHMLGWASFRGVKVTYLSIPLLALLAFAAEVGIDDRLRGRLAAQVTALFRQAVRWKHVAVALVAVAVAAVYLIRSGNVGAALVPPIEQHMRDALQQFLTYRPREKEFLVGYPCMFLASLAAARRSRWWFLALLLGASVSQVSLADTFEHAHTPLLYSVFREAVGLGLGLVTGTAALAAVWIVDRLRRRSAPSAATQAALP